MAMAASVVESILIKLLRLKQINQLEINIQVDMCKIYTFTLSLHLPEL